MTKRSSKVISSPALHQQRLNFRAACTAHLTASECCAGTKPFWLFSSWTENKRRGCGFYMFGFDISWCRIQILPIRSTSERRCCILNECTCNLTLMMEVAAWATITVHGGSYEETSVCVVSQKWLSQFSLHSRHEACLQPKSNRKAEREQKCVCVCPVLCLCLYLRPSTIVSGGWRQVAMAAAWMWFTVICVWVCEPICVCAEARQGQRPLLVW